MITLEEEKLDTGLVSSELTLGHLEDPTQFKLQYQNNPGSEIVSRVVYDLVKDYGIEAVLVGVVKALKKMKNPEHLVFAFYLVARRAVREITK